MAKGWITLDRKIIEHWLWEDEPFSKAQAWIDLLLHANHKPTKIKIKGKIVQLDIGQQARSEVTLANLWKWSRNKVRRFLDLLESEEIIHRQAIQQTTIISICNYKEYQQRDRTDETGGGTGTGQVNARQTHSTPKKHPKNDTGIRTANGTANGTGVDSLEVTNDEGFEETDCEDGTANGTANETGGGTGGGTGTGQVTEQHAEHSGTMFNNVNNGTNIKTPSESARGDPGMPAEKPRPKKYKFETHHHELAVRMSNPVKCRFPSQQINLDEWADAVRKLQELDKRPREEIIRLWHWIVNHERGNFSWAENCRSPMKLREKKDGLSYYEIIRTQMLRETNPARPAPQSLEDQLTDRSWAADLQTIEGR